MNPPFSRRQDIHHVTRAYTLLKHSGVLIAVMARGVVFRRDKLTTAFRDLVNASGGHITGLPEGTFASEGTNVNTVLVKMFKI